MLPCLSVSLHLTLFTPSFSFFASAQRGTKRLFAQICQTSVDTFSQLLIRSAVVGTRGTICPGVPSCAALAASASYRGFVRKTLPSSQTYGWALGHTKKYKESLESTPVGKCFSFRLSHKCSFILYFSLLFSLILCRQKRFSKQFQPWHLLVQCLPQPAIHICSPHKLDPIRQHQTMPYSSISPAQCQGS